MSLRALSFWRPCFEVLANGRISNNGSSGDTIIYFFITEDLCLCGEKIALHFWRLIINEFQQRRKKESAQGHTQISFSLASLFSCNPRI